MSHRKTTTGAEAFHLIRSSKTNELRTRPVSQHFSWGEVFVHRTNAEIERDASLDELEAAYRLAQQLDVVRGFLGNRPITVTSWWRDRATQVRLVGEGTGATNSWHVKGRAADIKVAGLSPTTVYNRLKSWWPGEVGNGARLGFTHLADSIRNENFNY